MVCTMLQYFAFICNSHAVHIFKVDINTKMKIYYQKRCVGYTSAFLTLKWHGLFAISHINQTRRWLSLILKLSFKYLSLIGSFGSYSDLKRKRNIPEPFCVKNMGFDEVICTLICITALSRT